jgi:Ca-activated chloride channel family protein
MQRRPRFLPQRSTVRLFLAGTSIVFSSIAARAAANAQPTADGIAIAIVFDTSGSMTNRLAAKTGTAPTKIAVARRAFTSVIARLEAFTKGPAAKPLTVGVYVFRGNDAAVGVPMSAFDPAKLRTWLEKTAPNGPTPLGAAMSRAGRDLLAVPATSRHILVLTDGENTAGPSPEIVLRQLTEASTRASAVLFTHIIAFDIKPEIFAALKKQGATLIGATDEAQLNEKFDFILDEKILVEAPRSR